LSSPEWNRFMDNYYGDSYMMWHDGIDEKSVTKLNDEEREKAEDMLIQSLEDGSHYGAIGLRELRSKKAIPFLIDNLESGGGTLKVEIAVALCLIEYNLVYLPHIIDVLRSGGFWSYRIDAARALRRFPTEEVVEALFESVAKDSEYLVRNHASETILFLHGLHPQISEHKEIFQHMIVNFDVDDEPSVDNAFKHYQTSSELLRNLINTSGKLRQESIIEDIWTWKQ